MNISSWQKPRWLPRFLWAPVPEPAEQASRILTIQRNIILPAKVAVIAAVFYYLFYAIPAEGEHPLSGVVLETLQHGFVYYVIFNAIVAFILIGWRFRSGLVQWIVFTVGLVDGLLLAGLTVKTGGFDSNLFWVFPCLIVINALSIPLATPQIALNLALSALFVAAGYVNISVRERGDTIDSLPVTWSRMAPAERRAYEATNIPVVIATEPAPPSSPESSVLRLIILLLMTTSAYGVQLLAFRERLSQEEAQKSAARNDELKAAGRLAAEIAHQLKNPLGIINNAAFSLQRGVKEGRDNFNLQIEIIREEVERSDRIITQLMGYAQLSEGRVEKLDLAEEIDRALTEVLPPGTTYDVKIKRDYGPNLPAFLMQRNHLSSVLVNLVQNAREALNGRGTVSVQARCRDETAVEVVISDDGPGIPADKLDKIFEPYFTSKKKGTGLGLAIVKHNVELYGGTVRVESKPGNGAQFILSFPPKTFIRIPA